LALVVSCRKDAPPAPSAEAASATASAAPAESAVADDRTDGAAGRAARELEERLEQARVDGGRAGVCEGASLALFAALLDPRCAANGREWSAALDAGKALLRQQATRDGEQVAFALVNDGTSPVVVPLRYRPGRPDLPAFSVFADGGQHDLYELVAPTALDAPAEAPSPDAGPLDRVRTARLRLPSHGAARARLRIDPRVSRRLAPPCPDASPACGEGRLAPGRYVLYVGLLLAGIDAGEPARVEWDVPP
jgi:hypothetical protein